MSMLYTYHFVDGSQKTIDLTCNPFTSEDRMIQELGCNTTQALETITYIESDGKIEWVNPKHAANVVANTGALVSMIIT